MSDITYHDPQHTATVMLQLEDGREVSVRHIRPEDSDLLVSMFWQLSSETRWRRFFVPLDRVDPERVRRDAERQATIDPAREMALVACITEGGTPAIVGVANYVRLAPDCTHAEGAIVIRDDYQHVGLGTQLFDLLMQVAMAQGLEHIVLLTQADNYGVIGIVQNLGLPFEGRFTSGMYEIDLLLGDDAPPVFPFSSA